MNIYRYSLFHKFLGVVYDVIVWKRFSTPFRTVQDDDDACWVTSFSTVFEIDLFH